VSPAADKDSKAPVAELCALHESRASAELRAAEALAPGSDAVASRGALLAEVVIVKGLRGPAEESGGAALSGADGTAAVKALSALGYDEGALFFTLARPEPGIDAKRRALRIRAQIEAVDPQLVLAVDREAAEDVADAFGLGRPEWGREVRVLGRRIVAVDGLEASLADPARKRRVWDQLKAARPPGPVY
jgi:hypothetical protein